MKKIVGTILIVIILVIGIYFVQNISYVENNNNNINSNLSDISSEQNTIKNGNNNLLNTTIKERGELKTSGLYNYNGDMSYENDLMQNDMTWHTECSLYHRIITNMNDYNKYKERIAIPEMVEDDFNDTFLVIIADENLRKNPKETNLMVYDVSSDETTTYIKMKQKDNSKDGTDQELMNNVFYAIIDKSQLKENINVSIEY